MVCYQCHQTQYWLTKSLATVYIQNGVAHRGVKCFGFSGFVKKLAQLSVVLTKGTDMRCCSTARGRIKKWRRWMCLVFVCSSGL